MLNKMTGVVTEYDGYIGKIKSLEKEYLLKRDNVKPNKDIKTGDEVSFLEEKVVLFDSVEYIATFVDLI